MIGIIRIWVIIPVIPRVPTPAIPTVVIPRVPTPAIPTVVIPRIWVIAPKIISSIWSPPIIRIIRSNRECRCIIDVCYRFIKVLVLNNNLF
jgi:hypothetical protein